MKALIDGDILVYEAGMAAEIGWKSDGIAPFEYVEGLLESSVTTICAAAKCNEPPLIFLSTDNNFRYNIATTRPYKGTRKRGARPFHYDNIRAYLPARWDTIICDGFEADDGMSIYQYSNLHKKNTIICSRDKDLWIVPGWHYTWGRGLQPEAGPTWVDELGWLELHSRVVTPSNPAKKPYTVHKCKGAGLKFFYAQCIMGDPVDNIPGLPGSAAMSAFNTINPCNSEKECHEAVKELYKIYTEGDEEKANSYLLEQAQLLWMVREYNEDGTLKMWSAPNVEY